MAFSTSYSDLSEMLPEGTYEMIITGAGEETDQTGKSRLSIAMVIRNDVQQEHQNYMFYHAMFKLKDPKPVDAQTCNYSFNSIMRIAQSAKLPESKQYNNLGELLADFINRPVKVDIYHDEYNGKKNARIKYWYASDVPEIKHAFKNRTAAPTQPQTQAAASSPLPWVK